MKLRPTLLLALLVHWSGPVQAGKPMAPLLKRGEVAPDLSVDAVLQGPDIADVAWQRLRGRVTVVDFWGTWCAPCVASIPHINDLVKRFEAQGAVFLSVSDEEAGVVEAFLGKKPINTWIALDNDSTMFIEFGAQQLPLTVVVDRDLRVARVTRPDALRPWMIQELLDRPGPLPQPLPPSLPRTHATTPGRGTPSAQSRSRREAPERRAPREPLPIPGPIPGPTPGPPINAGMAGEGAPDRPEEAATADVSETPSPMEKAAAPTPSPTPIVALAAPRRAVAAGTMSLVRSKSGDSEDSSIRILDGLFVARSTSLAAILSVAYSVEFSRIEGLDRLPRGLFNLQVSAPGGNPDLDTLARGILSRHGVAIRTEDRTVDVLELRRERPWLLGPSRLTASRTELGPGRIKGRLVDLRGLSAALSEALSTMVVDATDVPGRFDIDLNWDSESPKSVDAALAPLGLTLKPSRRTLKYVVVSTPDPS